MTKIALLEKELTDLSKTYGEVYHTEIGDVAYTKIVEPKGFVLQAKNQQLRYYLYKKLLGERDGKKIYGAWEHVWGASSIIHDGLPISEGLMQYKVKQGFKAGLKLLDDPEKFAAEILNGFAVDGTHVHGAMEDLLNGKEVTVAGRNLKQQWGIVSGARFVNDHQLRNWQTEQVVAYDHMHTIGLKRVRVVYAGTVDLIVEIYNPGLEKWETWLIDYKTSKEAQVSHRVQVLGYQAATEMSLGIKIDRLGVLLLGKQTLKGYQLIEVGNERKYKYTFDDFLDVYKMALRVHEGMLPAPTYKVFPSKLKITEEK